MRRDHVKEPRTRIPLHFMERKVLPIHTITEADDMARVAAMTLQAMFVAHHNSKSGSYLLVDANGNVYVLGCGSVWNECIVNRNFGMLVGAYCERRTPTVEEIREDLCHHLEQIRQEVCA